MDIISSITSYPRTSIIIIALLVSFFISLVNYLILDKEKMREIKDKQKKLQEEMKNHKDNPQKLMELQKEMFSHMGETMRHSLKPMLITFVPLILIFTYMRGIMSSTDIASTWIWYYIGASLISSIVFRKLFNLP